VKANMLGKHLVKAKLTNVMGQHKVKQAKLNNVLGQANMLVKQHMLGQHKMKQHMQKKMKMKMCIRVSSIYIGWPNMNTHQTLFNQKVKSLHHKVFAHIRTVKLNNHMKRFTHSNMHASGTNMQYLYLNCICG
jgi:hypothetical protein